MGWGGVVTELSPEAVNCPLVQQHLILMLAMTLAVSPQSRGQACGLLWPVSHVFPTCQTLVLFGSEGTRWVPGRHHALCGRGLG